MKIKVRLFKISAILLMAGITIITALALFLPYLMDVNAYRTEILDILQKSLHRQVSFRSGSFAWHFGPSFVFKDFEVKGLDGKTDLLSAKQITIQLAFMPLLEKRVELKNIELSEASLSLIRNPDGKLNVNDLLEPGKDSVQIQLKHINLKKCSVVWSDFFKHKDGQPVKLSNVQLALEHLGRGQKGHIKLSAEILALNGPPSNVSFSGTVRLPKQNISLMETELNCETDLKQAEIGRFWTYYGTHIPFANTGGRLDLSSSFKGKLLDFSAKGKIRINKPKLYWPTVFHATLSPDNLKIDYSIKLDKSLIDISSLTIGIDNIFGIKGTVQLFDYNSKDPRIIAKASTPRTFKYEEIRNYVPYGIIEKDASDYVENKIKSGIFKLDTGVLDGRISQIAHMEVGENYNTLTIRGPVENAVLSYGPKAPSFNRIKGTIELKGKNFNLIGMSGLFGTSPFKLDGSITEYNTDKRSDYPVRMDILPRPTEIGWLAKIAGASKLVYNNSSNLKLTGSGHHSAYHLAGEWDLKDAAYSFPGAVDKLPGLANNLAFSAIIGKTETKLTSVSYNLSPMIISGNALFRYDTLPYLGFNLQTNRFQITDSVPILTMWQQYRPRGKVQANISGSGNPEDFSAMDYNGTITLNSFSAQPGDKLKPISGINGAINFRGNGMETSSISARYGNSLLTVKGSIARLSNPEAEILITSPELFLNDLNLPVGKPDSSIKRLNASFSVLNGLYTIKSVSGLINSSNFNISGTCQTGKTQTADITVASSSLDIADLLLLLPGTSQATPTAGNKADIKLRLLVDEGKYKKVLFNKLSLNAYRESGTIYVQDLNAGVFGGKVAAKGRIAKADMQGNRYDMTIDLNKVNSDRLLTSLDISREITGDLTMHADLTAKGQNLMDIKKTALGNIRLKVNNGKLRKFNTLSKVFSILNISQLLKFQLPDMVSGGMPFTSINGSIAVEDGRLSTQDLFISSDAINISIVGSTDIIKEELNLKLGVQPLQTVDKVVNRIPIVGWLLTGKDKSFITAYFEAKGKWSDPTVSAIPVKSMGMGVLNIFRRTFELPVRLFTDTGEVILGQ